MFKNIINKLTNWEHWPFYIFYFPISFKWLWYYIKSKSLWFFTASNPTLDFGGFEGEGKTKISTLIPAYLYPRSILINPSASFLKIKEDISLHKISYPFIVKPDVGMKGILFRVVETERQLKIYHDAIPVNYIIQEFINMPYEVSVFYYRRPDQEKGCITALIQKNLPFVTGDGINTLHKLIVNKRELNISSKQIKKQYGQRAERILPAGEIYVLSHIANLYNGAKFISLYNEVDDKMLQVFDKISHSNNFYYGRYDIKCSSIEDIREGKNFLILEFNGAGSVPNHIYAGGYTLLKAYKEILMHWKALFEISEYNCEKGIKYWNLAKGYKFLRNSKKHFDVLKKLDKELFLN